jgi:hypothetical protein
LSPEDEVDRLKKERVNSVREYFRKKEYQYRQRKTCETSKEISGFLEEHKAELYPVIQQMCEDMK